LKPLAPHVKDLGGGFVVRRLLPAATARSIGPFVFFDHMGPTRMAAAHDIGVRAHPHIGLATVTYLFAGAILHRDSLGTVQTIEPGAVNWMIAGRGIVHSERTPPEQLAHGQDIHGIQVWVALPLGQESLPPAFYHLAASTIPHFMLGQASVRLIAGDWRGYRSPAPVASRTLYAHIELPQGAALSLDTQHIEQAIYVVSGSTKLTADGGESLTLSAFHMVELPQEAVTVTALSDTQLMLVGGDPLEPPREETEQLTREHPRHMWWNLVHSSQAEMDLARREWASYGERMQRHIAGDATAFAGELRFLPVPGEREWIPGG
jgi:redox-sensitive bicupin YhaK (pirin superfamily)